MNSLLVTGGAGFIGSHLVDRLLDEGCDVTVIDNLDPYYDPARKRANLEPFRSRSSCRIEELSILDGEALDRIDGPFDTVVHLAAKCGVRASLSEPEAYGEVNVLGTQKLLERCRAWNVDQFVFGSSSSVYGVDADVPWHEEESDVRPVSPYAATKRSGELLGHVYSHEYGLRFVSLRFFSVYGARQRPDLAIHKFTRKILDGETLPLFGDGSSYRDYTHVSDVVDGIVSAVEYDERPFRIFNLGNGDPVTLDGLVEALEGALGVKAKREYLPPQPGDVPRTLASIDRARGELGYEPAVELEDGLMRFAEWAVDRYAGTPVLDS